MEIIIALLLVCAVWASVASVLITIDLKKRGISVSFFWLRLMFLKYLHKYRQITQAEDGHIGHLFYHFVVPINLALVAAIVMVFVA